MLKTSNYPCAFCSVVCFSVDKALLLRVFSLDFSLDPVLASHLFHLSKCVLCCWVLVKFRIFWQLILFLAYSRSQLLDSVQLPLIYRHIRTLLFLALQG